MPAITPSPCGQLPPATKLLAQFVHKVTVEDLSETIKLKLKELGVGTNNHYEYSPQGPSPLTRFGPSLV